VGGGDELAADSPTKVRVGRHKIGLRFEGPRKLIRGPFFMSTWGPVCGYAKMEPICEGHHTMETWASDQGPFPSDDGRTGKLTKVH
jgi:hypothetical protein